jgi:hypothetical protein
MGRTLDNSCCIYATEAAQTSLPACKTTRSGQNHPMRNPDPWSPMEPEEPEVPEPLGHGDGSRNGDGDGSEELSTRRGALVGLVLVLLLVAGGLLLTHVLRSMAQLQDCALSGRSNCT